MNNEFGSNFQNDAWQEGNNRENNIELREEKSEALDEEARRRQIGLSFLTAKNIADIESTKREKITHPYRPKNEADILRKARNEAERARDVEINQRREFRNANKKQFYYGRGAAMRDMPNTEFIEEPIREPEKNLSVEDRIEKAMNKYESNFDAKARKWVAYGASTIFERGVSGAMSAEMLATTGFGAIESDQIHKTIDSGDTFSLELIDAEHELKMKIMRELIPEKTPEISQESIDNSIMKGALYSIYTGASIDAKSGKVIYAINPDKNTGAREIMQQSGIDFDSRGSNARARQYSYQGFANVIEAIKNDPSETERGFKALDWYYDNFKYGSKANVIAFTGNMSEFEENADDAWRAKYEEYLTSKKEVNEYYEGLQEAENIPLFEEENVEEDISAEELCQILESASRGKEEGNILPRISPNYGGGHAGTKRSLESLTCGVEYEKYGYIDTKKLQAIIRKYQQYSELEGSDVKMSTVYWENQYSKNTTHYVVLEHTCDGHKAAIIAPYEANSSNAAYGMIDIDWRDVFIAGNESKQSVRDRSGVKAFNHRSNVRRNLNAIDNMWSNYENFIRKSISES